MRNKLLFVDDDADTLASIQYLLQRWYDVLIAGPENPFENALRLCEQNRDIRGAFVDLQMPDAEGKRSIAIGIKLIDELNKQPGLMTFAHSAFDSPENRAEAFKHGVKAFLRKTLPPQEILARLDQYFFREAPPICNVMPPADWLMQLRKLWGAAESWRRSDRVSLAVLQGIAERTAENLRATIAPRFFFQQQLDQIQRQISDPLAIECEATKLGLSVLDTEEEPIGIEAFFGNVEEIEGSLARIGLLDRTDGQLQCVTSVPVNWLPRTYRREGAGVAWVERQYSSGAKGRFEPASDVT